MSVDLARLKQQFIRNRRQSIILGMLVVVMGGLAVRLLLSGSPRPASAGVAARPAAPQPTITISAEEQAELERRARDSQGLWKVLRERRGLPPVVTFTFKPQKYPLDPNARALDPPPPPPPQPTNVSAAPVVPASAVPAPAALTAYELAAALELQTTLLGANPVALIKIKGHHSQTQLVHIGERIEGFRVTAIQSRQVLLVKDGSDPVPLSMADPDLDAAGAGRAN